ncbi:unnamed protein product [Caenorhabditis brenneri]
MSTALSAPFIMQQSVKEIYQWIPPESCGYPANSSLARYGSVTEYDIDDADANIIFFWTSVFEQTVKVIFRWIPPESCGYPANSSIARYGSVTAYDIDDADANIIFFWTSVFENLPPIILPLITTGLIRILKEYEANRAHLSGGSNEATLYNTTILVVMMTVCLMVTEASYRLSDAIIMFLDEFVPTTAMLITINLHLSFQILYPLNSIAHCLINMMLSSEYRKIVKDLVTPKPGFNSRVTRYNTTKLVVMMTVCLMVTEGSYRISDAIIWFLEDFAARFVTINFNLSFRIFYPLNSIAHCFINMLLSSEYRKTIKESFACFKFCGSEQESSQSRNSGSRRNVPARMT